MYHHAQLTIRLVMKNMALVFVPLIVYLKAYFESSLRCRSCNPSTAKKKKKGILSIIQDAYITFYYVHCAKCGYTFTLQAIVIGLTLLVPFYK
jgi:hypothetical protein